MMKKIAFGLRAQLMIFLFGAAAFGQTIGEVAISPASSPVGVSASVRATAAITDPGVITNSVNLQRIDAQGRVQSIVGSLNDDGINGDTVAGDKVFTIRFTVFEQNPGPLTFRVTAGFQGVLVRPISAPLPFSVTGSFSTGITIAQPANLVFINTSPITVSGTVGDPGATVMVNGLVATKNQTAFQTTVPLQEGNNTITAVATNPNGSTSSSSIQVTLDTTPPRLSVDSPVADFVTTDSAVTVTGIVNDIVVGTVNQQQARVTVNGLQATVANRTYSVSNVPLQLGVNVIQVTGRDQTGNSATTSVSVVREATTQPYIKLISGNNQTGLIGTPLPSALVVQLLNGTTPVPNTPVIFKVTENDGFLLPSVGQAKTIVVNTNAQGQAQVNLTLGSRSGAGNNTVEAYSGNFRGTALFVASGTPRSAFKINVDSGTNQFGPVNQALALPFVAVVTDQGNNRLSGVPVTFAVRQGGGTINGAASFSTVTDGDGRALAVLTLGSQPGQDNNVVEANFAGNTGLPAGFTASAKVPGLPSQTTISGLVLDNSNNPIPGVTMRVFRTNQGNNNSQPMQIGTPVTTDAKGLFKIVGAPVGFYKLMADGQTATVPGKQYPTLEYDIVTVAGQDNSVGTPIYLPALDPLARVCVTATTGGILRVSSSPGFSLTIAPGSATFPGGSKTGCVSVTPVNPDKVPMVPGFGQQPRYVVTIQPVGTTFNPPAQITIPNMDGLAPGAKTEMYSFDHDLAAFVAIGSASVSPDGSIIASDPGIGVIKAGWHCGGNPNQTGSAGTCPECNKCQGTSCVPDNSKGCDDKDQCTKDDKCVGGACKGTPIDVGDWTDNAAIGGDVKLDGLKDAINRFLTKVPFPIGFDVKDVRVGAKGRQRNCCGKDTGRIDNGITEGSGTFQITINIIPFGKKFKDELDFFVAKITVDIEIGLASIDLRFNAEAGLRHDACKMQNCGFGQFNASLDPQIGPSVSVKACLIVVGDPTPDCFANLKFTPLAIRANFQLGYGYNLANCGDAGKGFYKIGELTVRTEWEFFGRRFVGQYKIGEGTSGQL